MQPPWSPEPAAGLQIGICARKADIAQLAFIERCERRPLLAPVVPRRDNVEQ